MLAVSDVESYYGRIRALNGVSVSVQEGQIVAILGANGAGKSTLLRTISGMLKPGHGSIRFQGRRIDGLSPASIVKRGISHVPERRQIFAKLTVLENLKMGAYTRRDGAAIKRDLQRMVGYFPVLGSRSAQLAGTLSGGEQQMLAIARALMACPKLLLLDEPSLGLAPLVTREIFKILQTVNAEGTTILLVEQNARAALRLASYAYVLETGQVALAGTWEDLMREEYIRQVYLGETA